VLDIHNVSTEERKARSEYRLDATHTPYRRAVNQINIETNQIIRTYPSIREAAIAI
jgi:hypothetical protein